MIDINLKMERKCFVMNFKPSMKCKGMYSISLQIVLKM